MTDDALRALLSSSRPVMQREPVVGRVVSVGAGKIGARLPNPRVGRCYAIARGDSPLIAQLSGFDGEISTLLPFSGLDGVEPGASIEPTEIGVRAPSAREVLGDVIDPLGVSLVTGKRYRCEGALLDQAPPSPLARQPIDRQLATGLRAVDGLLPLGVGQRVGLFAGSGVGKSTLLGQLARGAKADVCIVGLVGERGREVAEFVQETLQSQGMERTTVVVATSDAPPMLRQRAAATATALAEEWRDEGAHCLLLVDSLTRYARALREAALLGGEQPARHGYPASVFAELPRLLERAGAGSKGVITAIYTVLVAGGDMDEPIADEVRGIVDGHWVLSRRFAERGHFPALDLPASVSRVEGQIVEPRHLQAAREVRRAFALLGQYSDALELGIYEPGSNPLLDAVLDVREDLEDFVRQGSEEFSSLSETQRELFGLAREVGD